MIRTADSMPNPPREPFERVGGNSVSAKMVIIEVGARPELLPDWMPNWPREPFDPLRDWWVMLEKKPRKRRRDDGLDDAA